MASPRAGDPCGLAMGRRHLAIDRPLYRGPWPQPVTPLQGALATVDRPLAGGHTMADCPYRRPGRGWPPILLLIAFAAKIQQRVERFYVIQSHHT
ncbi:hypothetical protein BHE74_00058268 [Ensete ventricosum]|nr:hypothetical protein GW17_00020554 [Ensete ventricosum]RWW36690.1 hypothetical protein BHE74_00058268 [Ensete ventricosum]RZS28197.1 hypothetical protein BHM03_00061763 [Ensete ventricosum]